jgi:hypothetical protein
MDLGLAQLMDETEGRLTRTRQFVGTLRYASPEQVLAANRMDRRTDIYSLGATLWEVLTLQPIYGATEQTPTPELMEKIQREDPERPRKHNPRVPGDLQAIVVKCLEKERARRYATAADLAADLARWQRGEPVLAQPPSLTYLLRKRAWRYRVPLTAVAVVLLLAVVSLVASFLQISAALDREKQAKDETEKALEAKTAALERAREQREVLLNYANGRRMDVEASFKSAQARLAKGNTKEAQDEVKQAVDVSADLVRILEKVYALDSSDAGVQEDLARALSNLAWAELLDGQSRKACDHAYAATNSSLLLRARVTLFDAYLLNQQHDAAANLYRENQQAIVEDSRKTFAEEVQEDFKILQDWKLPGIEDARKLLDRIASRA